MHDPQAIADRIERIADDVARMSPRPETFTEGKDQAAYDLRKLASDIRLGPPRRNEPVERVPIRRPRRRGGRHVLWSR